MVLFGKLRAKGEKLVISKLLALAVRKAAEGDFGPQLKWLYWKTEGSKTNIGLLFGALWAALAYGESSGICAAQGWDCKSWDMTLATIATTMLGLGLYDGAIRTPPPSKPDSDVPVSPSRFPAPLLLLLALPMLSACGSLAQVRLGGEARIHPDARVVQSYVCAGDDDPARLYLGRPEYAWLGGALERYITDARDERTLGKCPCAKDGCQK